MTDEETEYRVAQVTERAKHLLRVEQAILAHWVEGLTGEQSAERLSCSASTVDYLRRHLQLTSARSSRVKPMGRRREVKLVVEVRHE